MTLYQYFIHDFDLYLRDIQLEMELIFRQSIVNYKPKFIKRLKILFNKNQNKQMNKQLYIVYRK